MEISTAHHQAMSSHQLEELLGGCSPNTTQLQQHKQQQNQERKQRTQPEQSLRCPRCDSTSTKFCYYNNYSLTQPRYFCKGCRRYWTQGGSLRNVPVGGGCRKNKRSSSSSSSSSSSKKAVPNDHHQAIPNNSNPLQLPTLPPLSYESSDLTLQFARLQNHSNTQDFLLGGNPNPNPNDAAYLPTNTGLLDILRGGFLESTTTTTTGGGFHNLYYGYDGHGNGSSIVEEVERGGGGGGGEGMMVPFDGQLGSCKGMDHGGESKVLMGLQPWQMSVGRGDGNNIGVDAAGREYWNVGVAGSSWHGLINSSLM